MPYNFYIEPDGAGRWRITMETGAGTQNFYVVEQVDVPDDGPPVMRPSAERRRASRGTLGVHLKEKANANYGMVL